MHMYRTTLLSRSNPITTRKPAAKEIPLTPIIQPSCIFFTPLHLLSSSIPHETSRTPSAVWCYHRMPPKELQHLPLQHIWWQSSVISFKQTNGSLFWESYKHISLVCRQKAEPFCITSAGTCGNHCNFEWITKPIWLSSACFPIHNSQSNLHLDAA